MVEDVTPSGSLLVWAACLCAVLVGCADRSVPRAALTWHEGPGYRWADVAPGSRETVGFERLSSAKTGISFENRLTEAEINGNQHVLNGSGVAAGDVDGDGWTDLYFARLAGGNRLYRNRGGFAFEDVTDTTGVAHTGYYSTSAVFADVDGDGDLDLLVGSMHKGIALYLNDGQGRFSRQSNVSLERGKGNTTLALADVDGDGDLDVYVTNYKEKPVQDVYPNDELATHKITRREHTSEGVRYRVVPPFDEHYTIISREHGPSGPAEIGEVDALYLNTGDGTFRKVQDLERRFRSSDGALQGLAPDWGLTARFQDLNRDGRPDLYVCNDFWTPDRIWLGRGDGTFRAIDPLAIRNLSFSSMTVDASDVNRDGALDLFVTEMLSPSHRRRLRQLVPNDPFPTDRIDSRPQYNRNSLYLNRGDGTYAEVAYFSGVEATGWSWATRFLDVDLDGYEDLLVATGFSHDFQDIDTQRRVGRKMTRTPANRYLTEYPPLPLPNKAFRNDGLSGTGPGQAPTFSEVSAEWGFTEADVSHGLATADFDRDGDLDLAVSRLNEVAAVYENRTSAPRIAVRLSGRPPNTRAVGAKVALAGGPGGPAPQQKEILAGGDYLSGSAPTVVFAAEADNPNHVLTVTWPDGPRTRLDSVRANRIYEIRAPDGRGPDVTESAFPSDPTRSEADTTIEETIFEDVSARLAHRHHEAPYDDFRVQPLLPVKLSRQGPGLAWIDYDYDGDDDLFIASGRGGRLAIYENDGGGHFKRRALGPLTRATSADQTAVVGWPTERGATVLVGRSNYEPADVRGPSVLHYAVRAEAVVERAPVPGAWPATGPLAAADYDLDGDVDLFVGGRFLPAQYPADASSRLFENDGRRFVLDDASAEALSGVGLVTGAVFTDYDLDGDPDLLLSREWASLALFENEQGAFRDVTEEVGLDRYTGWWNGVATGDFNGDGRPDLVATNWGQNSPYRLEAGRPPERRPLEGHPLKGRPLKMYYGDFNGDRRVELVEAYYAPALGAYAPRRQLGAFEAASVSLSSTAKTHRAFARASLREILGYDPDSRLSFKAISTLEHTLFVNEGGRFTARPLPAAAQLSAAFHAGVADYDNDGREDLFLSQNFFAVRPQMPRLDAGRGLWMKGDGQGGFTAVPGHVSGVEVYGEQRGAALADFNGDGRVDLAVSQNGAATKLYANRTPQAGVSVRPVGPASNRAAVGSSLRLLYADGSKGPRREVQAGAGYWSQGSATQVMGAARTPEQIEVTWFDGRVDTVDVAEGKRTYVIEYSPF